MAPSDIMSSVWRDGIFDKKVIFCTGGAGTICSNQVRAMVQLGANACIIGRNVEKTERVAKDIASSRPGAKVVGIGAVDVRKIESLTAAADQCAKELGAIDYVIAGAAGNFIAPISALSANAFRTVIDIDVNGSYNTLKATMPYLIDSAAKKAGGGRIIFISASFHYTGAPLQTHVVAAKAAVDALSANVALELGPRGVTSNIICPGPIAGTEGMERLATKSAMSAANTAKVVPLARYGTVKEIADATIYLFSDTGNFVNGAVLVVDGGSWRLGSAVGGEGLEYPRFLLSGEEVKGVKTGRREKARL